MKKKKKKKKRGGIVVATWHWRSSLGRLYFGRVLTDSWIAAVFARMKDDKVHDASYLKRLLTVAKRNIDDLKRKLSEKDAELQSNERVRAELRVKNDKLVDLAKRCQKRITELESRLEIDSDNDVDEVNGPEKRVPVLVVQRIQEPNNGPKWCLSKFPDSSYEWLQENELYHRVGDISLPFELPAITFSQDETAELQETIQVLTKQLEDTVEKFQKFRVKSEILKKQRESDFDKVSDTLRRYEQQNILQQNNSSETDVLKNEVDRLSTVLEANQRKISILETSIVQLKSQNAKQIEPKSDVCENASNHTADTKLILDQYSKLKHEYDSYRLHTKNQVEERDLEIANLQMDSKSTPETRLNYVKNIVMQYMAFKNNEDKLPHMEAALATALKFTSEELQFIHQQRTSTMPSSFRFW